MTLGRGQGGGQRHGGAVRVGDVPTQRVLQVEGHVLDLGHQLLAVEVEEGRWHVLREAGRADGGAVHAVGNLLQGEGGLRLAPGGLGRVLGPGGRAVGPLTRLAARRPQQRDVEGDGLAVGVAEERARDVVGVGAAARDRVTAQAAMALEVEGVDNIHLQVDEVTEGLVRATEKPVTGERVMCGLKLVDNVVFLRGWFWNVIVLGWEAVMLFYKIELLLRWVDD